VQEMKKNDINSKCKEERLIQQLINENGIFIEKVSKWKDRVYDSAYLVEGEHITYLRLSGDLEKVSDLSTQHPYQEFFIYPFKIV
jgi:hypothetical protein